MLDLQHDLAMLESLHVHAETQLATQQAEQQAHLQALHEQYGAENVQQAQEVLMLSGAIRHVRGQIAREEQAESEPSNGHAHQQDDMSLLQRIHRKQDANGAFYRPIAAAFPDNDPD